MNGYLLDENLPSRLRFSPSLPVKHVGELADNPTDTEIWDYAKENHWVIVTKDADFSNRIMAVKPPPRVVWLRFGNMRLANFHTFLADVWPRVERLLEDHKLVSVYTDRLEAVGE